MIHYGKPQFVDFESEFEFDLEFDFDLDLELLALEDPDIAELIRPSHRENIHRMCIEKLFTNG